MLYLFDDYMLDTQLYELRHAGALCPLEPQVFAVLHYLIQHRDRVVTRQELLEHVWPERFISEATLDHRVTDMWEHTLPTIAVPSALAKIKTGPDRATMVAEEYEALRTNGDDQRIQLPAEDCQASELPDTSAV